MFGGMDVSSGKTYGDMWVLDADLSDPSVVAEWEPLEPSTGALSTPSPSGRANHSLTRIDDFLFLFGGEAQGYRATSDTAIYSLATNMWLKTRAMVPYPPARHLHGATSVDNHLAVVSGAGAVRHAGVGDVWLLDTEIMLWRELATKRSPLVDADGKPMSITGACCAGTPGRLYLFGGLTPTGYNTKLWCLDMASLEWNEIPQAGDVPPPRARMAHAQEPRSEARVAVFGGTTQSEKSNRLYELTLPM